MGRERGGALTATAALPGHRTRRIPLTVVATALSVGLVVLTIAVALTLGPANVSLVNVRDVITNHLGLTDIPVRVAADAIVWQERLPRALVAAACGAGLGLCGVILQSLLRNPLADPFVLGVNYWPRRKAMYWWREFDAGEVKDEFAQIADLGLRVVRNSDDDTYLYVSVNTVSASDGLCVSRYDVTLYSWTTSKLEHTASPVLLQVELLRAGGLTGGAAAGHADGVMKGVLEYVDQFSARIRAANQ